MHPSKDLGVVVIGEQPDCDVEQDHHVGGTLPTGPFLQTSLANFSSQGATVDNFFQTRDPLATLELVLLLRGFGVMLVHGSFLAEGMYLNTTILAGMLLFLKVNLAVLGFSQHVCVLAAGRRYTNIFDTTINQPLC